MTSTKQTEVASCPAIFLSAPSSGEGKTTITAAIGRLFVNQGKRVRVFKTGPDYLDPQVLEQASKAPVEPIDMWMAGEDYCRERLYQAALESDLIIVEGAMGLFDGEPSSADLAKLFGIPIVLIMNVKGMAQTVSAVAQGLANYRDDLGFLGLIANQCGTERHAELISDALPNDLPLLARFPREESLALPERHLGLVQASEVSEELEERFEAGAKAIGANFIEDFEFPECHFERPVTGSTVEPLDLGQPLSGVKIGIAKDEAFSFIYEANLDCLRSMGATLEYFSPIHDRSLPEVDALWLPGGYPELYADKISNNNEIKELVKVFYRNGGAIVAECGGLLYCLEGLTDLEGHRHEMLGLLQGEGAMRGKRGCQGMQTAVLPEGDIRGHAHHRSRAENTPEPIGYCKRQRHPAPGEAIFREGGLTASYLHLFFPSNPLATAHLFGGKALTEAELDADQTTGENTDENTGQEQDQTVTESAV